VSAGGSGLFVVPGDALGVIEEYAPSLNTYERDGVVRAKVAGLAELDAVKHEARVIEGRRVPLPRPGDVVHAVVTGLRDAVVYVDVFYNETAKAYYPIPFRGVVHVSEVSSERVGSLYEVFGYGDVVRARVLSRGPPYMLTTKGPEFGLLLTRCPKCMVPLRRGGLWLRCPACGKRYKRRKVSRYYLLR